MDKDAEIERLKEWCRKLIETGEFYPPPATIDEFKRHLLMLLSKAREAGLDTLDVYDALNDEAEAFGQSFTTKQAV